jgi:hypothetical protein
MVLHLPHAEGGFGITFNDVTKDAAFYTTTSRFVAWLGAFSQERQGLWLPKDDLWDSSSWSSPPLLLLRDIHSKLLTQYDCKEVCAPSQSQVHVGARGGISSQDGVPQQQQAAPLSIPQLNRLLEVSLVQDESFASNAACCYYYPLTTEDYPTDPQPLSAFPGPQTYVCGLASRGTVESALTTAHSVYC